MYGPAKKHVVFIDSPTQPLNLPAHSLGGIKYHETDGNANILFGSCVWDTHNN